MKLLTLFFRFSASPAYTYKLLIPLFLLLTIHHSRQKKEQHNRCISLAVAQWLLPCESLETLPMPGENRQS